MNISFVLCTRDRAHALRTCLQSIADAIEAAPGIEAELIVVNNGSSDETESVVNDWILNNKYEFDFRLVFEARPGLAIARNTGISNSSGKIIVFTDDDCVLSRVYLSDLLKHYEKDTEGVIRGGRVELGDPADLPFTIKVEDHPAYLSFGTHPGGFVCGCNMSMSREVIARIGLFDERFGAGAIFRSAEDSDYLYRAQLALIPVEYVPDMIVFHFHGRNDRGSVEKLHFGYHFGNGALYAKHMFGGPRLFRHMYWDGKNAMKEMLGGPSFDPEIGLTYRSIIKGNVCGILSYGLNTLLGKSGGC